MDLKRAERLYRVMLTAREIDECARTLLARNLAFFHVPSGGHEAVAVLADHLIPDDYLHLHYRDKALLLARGVSVVEFLRSLLCRAGSHSAGRQMSAHLSAAGLRVLSMVGPVGNNALQAVGVAAVVKDRPGRPIVVCSIGDGCTQQGEFFEAVAEAVRGRLPVLFLIEDNHWAISTSTRGKTFFDLPSGPAPDFFGIPLVRVDGTDAVSADSTIGHVIDVIRDSRRPQLVVFTVERLVSHTNADDQSQYRNADEINHARTYCDPIEKLRGFLQAAGRNPSELDDVGQSVRHEVRVAANQALDEPEPPPVFTAKAPFSDQMLSRPEYRGNDSFPRLSMREAVCRVLRERLGADSRVFLLGQDIEDPKGDVFGVTRGLSTAFPGRVVNAPLSESTIVGTCIGRALAGQRPVAFIQFADFLPLAFNQIVSELATMYWRTNGGWECPVIILAACGGYKPGLGPFHAQTMDGFVAHIPGVDVVMPSSAADAAGLLNAAFESPRPTIFLYPKSCLNLTDRTTSDDVTHHFVLPGKARRLTTGTDLTLVTWGNPVGQCEQTVGALSEAGFSIDFFDLRSLSPWDETTVIQSAEKTGKLVVVHEDNQTGGFGAEVLAAVAEDANRPVAMRRIARRDTHVPFHFGNQLAVLPSFQRVLETCADLLDCDVTWEESAADPPGQSTIRAVGSGPADEMVKVVGLRVRVGDEVSVGQPIAEIEATKSVVEVCATVSGRVTEICVTVGQAVSVGHPILRVEVLDPHSNPLAPLIKENSGQPHLVVRSQLTQTVGEPRTAISTCADDPSRHFTVFLSRPATVLGSRIVDSAELAANIPGWPSNEVVKRTGVQSRRWILDGEDVVSLAIASVRTLLDRTGAQLPPISMIACSTTTPREATPSIACQVASAIHDRISVQEGFHAFDFNAACSGFLYGLRIAWDHLATHAEGAVLLVTSEGISPALDLSDPTTCFLFGDAASATLVTATRDLRRSLSVHRPVCFTSPDPGHSIWGPCIGGTGHLRMDGIAVARSAYKAMAIALQRAMSQRSLTTRALTAIIPHPGSRRILENVAESLEVGKDRIWSTLNDTGNTSSSSIPVTLDRYWEALPTGEDIGFTAFGAGFTSAAAIGRMMTGAGNG